MSPSTGAKPGRSQRQGSLVRTAPRSMLTFVGQAVKHYKWTGAIAPSSPRLARAMTRAVCTAAGPRRILEVGPGTGAFTRPLLATLRPGDQLDIVEINPAFCRRLDHALLNPFRKRQPDIPLRLHCAPIQDAPIEGPFDFIVCSLPFNIFPLAEVREIFRCMLDVLADDGELTYFEYAGMSALKAPVIGRDGRRSLRRRLAVKEALSRRHQGRKTLVLGNVPPAFAFHLRRTGEPAAAAAIP